MNQTFYLRNPNTKLKEIIRFFVQPTFVDVMWTLEYEDGFMEKGAIELEAWFETYDHPEQNPDGQYSIEDARWIWNALIQNNGFERWIF
jgi:hypothetical protein